MTELLIALSVLGLIAMFAIPKVLHSQQESRYKSLAKEAIQALGDAHLMSQNDLATGAAAGPAHFTPYLNYIKVYTTPIDDGWNITTAWNCGAVGRACLLLPNGGVIAYNPVHTFGGTGTTNAISFLFDPDGKHDSNATGPAKSLRILLYYNGNVRTWNNAISVTTDGSGNSWVPGSNYDPPWFSWD